MSDFSSQKTSNIIEDDEFKKRYKQKRRIFNKTLLKILNLRSENNISWGTIIENNAETHADRIAIKFEDITLTYKEFNEKINQHANYFISLGLKRGDVVVMLVSNRPEFLIIVGAIAKIGAIASLINIDMRERSLIHCLNLTPGKIIVIDEVCFQAFDKVKSDIPVLKEQELLFLPDEGLVDITEEFTDLVKIVKTFPIENPFTTSNVKSSDHLAYIWTSGTTGLPKPAIMIHRRILNGIYVFKDIFVGITPEDTIYIPLPFFHATPLGMGWSAALSSGAAIAIGRKFSVNRFWDEIRKHDATAFIYVGEVCRYLMNQPSSPDDLNNSVTKIIGNGLRPEIWKPFKKRFGITTVGEFYGASEGGGGFFNFFNYDCTVGYCPTPFAIVKYDVEDNKPIRGEDGFMQKVAVGETGLLLFNFGGGLGGFIGYTEKKATEEKLLRDVLEKGDTWINTGDLLRDIGNRHAEFVDRMGDTFRWKGHNVSTTEVEEVFNMFDQVLMSTVYGVKMPGTDGRAGMASIVARVKIEDFDFQGLTTLLRKNLPSYAIPIFLRFKVNLTLTSTFKLKKSQLKKEGFSIEKHGDASYIMLSGASSYVPLTKVINDNIKNQKYKL